jgi:tRNA threonylcarbamoyl adenosine modification protein (Sua5/YciO/YrdC/YwlC family)
MLLTIHKDNPPERLMQQVVKCLEDGGVIIYPTDTVYGIGCDIRNRKAIERICRIKGIRPEKASFSCICRDLSNISEYAIHVTTPIYKMMKRALPGPYTFILEASSQIPRYFQSNKRTVGIRVPDHKIPLELVRMLGAPLVNTSLHDNDALVEYTTDPELIHDQYEKLVDLVIDGGFGGNVPSTVVDCTPKDGSWEIIREGKGSVDILG